MIKLDKQNKGVYEFKGIGDQQKFYIQDDNLFRDLIQSQTDKHKDKGKKYQHKLQWKLMGQKRG